MGTGSDQKARSMVVGVRIFPERIEGREKDSELGLEEQGHGTAEAAGIKETQYRLDCLEVQTGPYLGFLY